MRVVVTGAHGFLGGWVAAAFGRSGARVMGVDRSPTGRFPHPAGPTYEETVCADLRAPGAYGDLLDTWCTDLVVHLAGPANVAESFEDPIQDLRDQIEPLMALYECVRRSRRRPRVLVVSSAAVYGEPVRLPISEDEPLRPISPYGFHKLQQELLVEEFAALHGVPGCRARVFSVYGEGLRRLAVWDIARRALEGGGFMQGTGEETRDYLHAWDVAAALVSVSEKMPFRGEAVNVASGEETPIADLARRIRKECGGGADGPLAGVAERGKPTRWRADTKKLRSTGFSPTVPLEEGLRRTVEWIRGQV